MRCFKLINSVGAEYDLTSLFSFMSNPQGLGFQRKFDVQEAGYSWIETDSVLSQKSPSGEIAFKSNAEFQKFISFISRDDPMYLYYKPDSIWYRCRCKVQTAKKTEITSPYRLKVPITFVLFGTWHELITATQAQPDSEAGKIYAYAYPYTYADTTRAEATVKNGDLVSPCKLHIFGHVVNPNWSLTQAGELILAGRVFATIAAGHKLVVDAAPDRMEIAEYTTDNEFVRDLYALSDFSTGRFVFAPPGTSLLTVTSEAGGAIAATVEVEKLAYAV